MLPLAVLLHCFELRSGLYFALFSGSPSSADSWLVGNFRRLWGQEPSGKMGEIKLGMFLASGKNFKPCYEAGSRKNTEVLHLVLQGRYPLFAYRHAKKKKKKVSTFNSILQVAGFATGHSVVPQFLARKDYCECQTCLAFSQV